jgi:hypothetical protein
VVEVTSRTTEAFTLPRLVSQFEIAKKERDAAQEERTKFAKDNTESLEKIIPKLRDDPSFRFQGKLGEIQTAWEEMLKLREEKEHAFQELKQLVNRDTSVAGKSVMRQLDVGKLEGDIAVTKLLLNLKSPDYGELPFEATLRKYNLKEPGSDRVEAARWVIVGFEGTTPEAKQAAEAASAKPKVGAKADAKPAEDAPAPSSREGGGYKPRELKGAAKVQMLTPETKVDGDGVKSTLRVRNASKDWITGFTVTEYWYDQSGAVVGTGSQTHRERFMPGEVLELSLRTRKGPNFFSNQFEFKHANGDVNATVVASFPKQNSD